MIDLSLFERRAENIYVLKKWNWDYVEAENFQNLCVDYVRSNPMVCLLIVCSHPHSFTLGRGLQKTKEGEAPLVDFDPSLSLPFPLYQIKRGGGLTFHYPGQFVFYPIMNLTHYKLGVFDLMLTILSLTQKTIEQQFGMSGLQVRRELLGLWFENDFSKAKLASIGLAANRFISYHGLALNFFDDEQMFQALESVHPCGLPGNIYRSLELLNCRVFDTEERETFSSSFLNAFIENNLLNHYLITDRQRSSSAILDSISF